MIRESKFDSTPVLLEKLRETIKDLRQVQNVSQAELAYGIGIHASRYCDFERGKIDFTIGIILDICTFMEVEPRNVFHEAENRVNGVYENK
jgi:transcriptional regulator with XRE-family HTH domain